MSIPSPNTTYGGGTGGVIGTTIIQNPTDGGGVYNPPLNTPTTPTATPSPTPTGATIKQNIVKAVDEQPSIQDLIDLSLLDNGEDAQETILSSTASGGNNNLLLIVIVIAVCGVIYYFWRKKNV